MDSYFISRLIDTIFYRGVAVVIEKEGIKYYAI